MNNDQSTPYQNLNPNLILEAVESTGLVCDGTLVALNSFENRVYQVGIEDAAPMIVKFYRPYRWTDAIILEEHQFSQELLELEIPVVSPWISPDNQTLHQHREFRFALFPRQGGRALEPDNLERLEWMGRFIGRLHAVSACRPFEHRPRLDVQTHGVTPYRFLIDNHFIPDYLKQSYCQTVETILQKITANFENAGPIRYIRTHGDMHIGNVLWRDEGPHIVDLDDCLMAPAIQDIWMLLCGDESRINLQLDSILKGYQEFHDFNYRELHLIESLRTLRQIQYSAWLARRWQDPAFPLNFPWFNSPHYWEERLRDLNEQSNLLG